MPDLNKTFRGNDLSFLQMVAEAWGVELDQPDAASALPALVNAMKDPTRLQEVLDQFPPEDFKAVHEALLALLEKDGRMPWATFCRQYGEIRAMGPGQRDRVRPDRNPASITELLWYRGLIGRAFFNLPPEPQEYAYLPDELLEHLHPYSPQTSAPPGRPASAAESAHPISTTDRILDYACTLLAALRIGLPLEPLAVAWTIPLPALLGLLRSASLLDDANALQTEGVRQFLEAGRAEALALLSRGWLDSQSFNELRLLPGLVCEGNWTNNPHAARHTLLEQLALVNGEVWWSLNSFVNAIHEKMPDFQRPAGDYDSWFIRRAEDKNFLRGFEAWEEVDGALVRYLICGPLHWLGWLDLASAAPNEQPGAFRPSAWQASLQHAQAPAGLPVEDAKLHALADGRLRLPALLPRTARYQISRFCEWEEETPEEFRLRLTPASLERARQQGLTTAHLLALLRRHAAGPLPPTLLAALEHWEKYGLQANLEKTTLLRLTSPEILTALRKTRAARFIVENLTATVVTIRPGGEEAIRQALAELGYLSEEQQPSIKR